MTGADGSVFRFEAVDARLDDLDALRRVTAQACDAADAPSSVRDDLRLAIEEAYTNIVTHGYGGGAGPVWCMIEARPGAVVVRLEDEAKAFEPAAIPPPPLAADWRDRNIGGLGWHMITQLMDEVRHAPRAPRGNVLTLVKRWET